MAEEVELVESDEQDLYEHLRIVVDKGQALLRIDKFLMNRVENASRNRIQHAIAAETVLVNSRPVKASYKVKPSDTISVVLPHPPRDTEIHPEDIPLDILYEDDDLLMPIIGLIMPGGDWQLKWRLPSPTPAITSPCAPARTAASISSRPMPACA